MPPELLVPTIGNSASSLAFLSFFFLFMVSNQGMSEVLSPHHTVNHAFLLFLCGWEEPEDWRILPVQSPAVMPGRSVTMSTASHCPADPLP